MRPLPSATPPPRCHLSLGRATTREQHTETHAFPARAHNTRQLLESLRREYRARDEESLGNRDEQQEPRQAQHGEHVSPSAASCSNSSGDAVGPVTATEQNARVHVHAQGVPADCGEELPGGKPQTRVACFRAALGRAAWRTAVDKRGTSG